MTVYKSTEYVNESDSDVSGQEYEPPKHFKKFKPASSFKPEDNKEIWLLKVPKGLPLEELKSLPISFTDESLENSSSLFKAGDKAFQVNEQLFSTTNSGKYTVLSSKGKDSYKAEKKGIERFYNIREVVEIPPIDYSRVVKKRKDVKKVKNLKVRHFATGYYAAEANGSEAEGEESVAGSESESEIKSKDEDKKVSKKDKLTHSSTKEKHHSSGKSEKKDKRDKKDKKEKKEKKHKKESKESKD